MEISSINLTIAWAFSEVRSLILHTYAIYKPHRTWYVCALARLHYKATPMLCMALFLFLLNEPVFLWRYLLFAQYIRSCMYYSSTTSILHANTPFWISFTSQNLTFTIWLCYFIIKQSCHPVKKMGRLNFRGKWKLSPLLHLKI